MLVAAVALIAFVLAAVLKPDGNNNQIVVPDPPPTYPEQDEDDSTLVDVAKLLPSQSLTSTAYADQLSGIVAEWQKQLPAKGQDQRKLEQTLTGYIAKCRVIADADHRPLDAKQDAYVQRRCHFFIELFEKEQKKLQGTPQMTAEQIVVVQNRVDRLLSELQVDLQAVAEVNGSV